MARLRVRVQPGARRDELGRWVDGVLRLKVTAPALEGRANRAVIELIANALGIPKGRVQIVHGETSRDKLLEIDGLDEGAIAAQVARTRAGRRDSR